MKNGKMLMMNAANRALIFTTNKNGTFSPSIATSDASVATWNVEGETPQTTNTPSFTLDGTDRIVKVTISDFSKITTFVAGDQGIKGTLNIRILSNITDFRVLQNPLLTQIINPTHSGVFTFYYAYGNDLTGTLDLSGLTGLANRLFIDTNANLTNVIFPITSQTFDRIRIYSCSLGVLDWSNINGSVDNIEIQNNSFTSAESDENIVNIDTDVSLTTTLDISGTNGILTDGTSTGFDGLAAKTSLEGEGVTVTANT